MSQPDITIGCATYGGAVEVSQCFKSIQDKTDYYGDIHLVLLDDGTNKKLMRGAAAALADHHGATFIQHEKRKGLSTSWNDLFRACDTEYMILIHDDMTILDPHWLSAFTFFMEENKWSGKIGPVELLVGQPGGWHIATAPQFSKTLSLACFGFSRDCYEEAGGFWEGSKFYYEDTAFFVDACKAGRYPVKLGTVAIEHNESRSAAEHPNLLEASLPHYIQREIVESEGTRKQYLRYVVAAGEVHDDHETWCRKMLALSPQASLSRYLFCKRYDIPVSLEHYHDEAYEKYIKPLEAGWNKLPIKWLDTSSGECVVKEA
jgi:GT2 family glycosyltransferase